MCSKFRQQCRSVCNTIRSRLCESSLGSLLNFGSQLRFWNLRWEFSQSSIANWMKQFSIWSNGLWSWKCPKIGPHTFRHVMIVHSKPICEELNGFEVPWVSMHQIRVVSCGTWRKSFGSTISICLKSRLMSAKVQSTSEDYPTMWPLKQGVPCSMCSILLFRGIYTRNSRSYDFRLACFKSDRRTWSCISRQRKVWRQYLSLHISVLSNTFRISEGSHGHVWMLLHVWMLTTYCKYCTQPGDQLEVGIQGAKTHVTSTNLCIHNLLICDIVYHRNKLTSSTITWMRSSYENEH